MHTRLIDREKMKAYPALPPSPPPPPPHSLLEIQRALSMEENALAVVMVGGVLLLQQVFGLPHTTRPIVARGQQKEGVGGIHCT